MHSYCLRNFKYFRISVLETDTMKKNLIYTTNTLGVQNTPTFCPMRKNERRLSLSLDLLHLSSLLQITLSNQIPESKGKWWNDIF
jgi:hypothetical protein